MSVQVTQQPVGQTPATILSTAASTAAPSQLPAAQPVQLSPFSQMDFDDPSLTREPIVKPPAEIEVANQTPTPAAAVPPAAAAPAAPAAPAVPADATIARARMLGVNPVDLTGLSDLEASRALNIVERQILAAGLSFTTDAQPVVPGSNIPAPQTAPEFKLEIDEETWDPDVAKTIKGMHQAFETKLKALEQKFAQVEQPVQAVVQERQHAAAQRTFDEFDQFVQALPTEYHDVLGTEPRKALKDEMPQLKARMELIGDIRTLYAGYQATGRPIPSHRELFDSAVRMRFGDRAKQKAAEATRERVAQQLRDRGGQFLARPNLDQQAPESDPTKRAVNALREKWGEWSEKTIEE